jgi:hypothetical protein
MQLFLLPSEGSAAKRACCCTGPGTEVVAAAEEGTVTEWKKYHFYEEILYVVAIALVTVNCSTTFFKTFFRVLFTIPDNSKRG